ncbi:protein kinase [bacterium]|nr:protein kinase [bacterium]
MNAILNKTMQSLETALRYNPNSTDLMAALAEVYIRMGRFDERTLELCRQAMEHQVDNALLRQAGEVGKLLGWTNKLVVNAKGGEPLPADEEMERVSTELTEFLSRSNECIEGWTAWTTLQILMGRLIDAQEGVKMIERLGAGRLDETFEPALMLLMKRGKLNPAGAEALIGLCRKIIPESRLLATIEKLYDGGQPALGQGLLELYLSRYSIERPNEMSARSRDRFFILLLDHGGPELTQKWTRRVALLGWEVGCYIIDHARDLIEQGELDEAMRALKQLTVDGEVRDMIDRIAMAYEQRGDYDKAAEILRYLNENALLEREAQHKHEKEMAREAEISMAELQIRNGRYGEALEKYVASLNYANEIDPQVLERIDELIDMSSEVDPELLVRLGLFFRQQQDHPKAMNYLQRAHEIAPDNADIAGELESLYNEILTHNPDLPNLRMELGKLYLRSDRHDAAIEQLRLAASSPAVAEPANRLLAEALLKGGRLVDALDRYRAQPAREEDFENIYSLHEQLIATQSSSRDAVLALDLIARVDPSWRDVGEKVRLMEMSIGKTPDADPKMRELIGDLAVGRYQYLDRLGSGGMGVVYKVFDIRNQQTVAMKILRDSLSGSSKALDRFFREARIAATLSHHNIVNIYDYNISNVSGQSYIVMEYVDGPALRELIDGQFRDGMDISLDYISEIFFYAVQLCDALGASHAKGIIHRDIKPDNIMINSVGEVKITDFGIVHIEENTLTPTGAMLGTPRYMSPEQVIGGKIDGRSDLYSVGIVLYEALVGSPPFLSGDISYQQVHKSPVAPRDINVKIPQTANEIIMKCLAKRPEDRYASADALRAECNRQLVDLGGCKKFNNSTEYIEPLKLDQGLDMDELDLPSK